MAGDEGPWATVVIPHWRRPELLRACLAALAAQTCRDFEVVVADDASGDGSAEPAREAGARVVVLPARRGFAAAANAGIRAARGEWVVLLNNDAEPEPGWLEALRRAAGEHPGAGMLACRIVFAADPGLIDNTGHLLYWDGLNRGRGRMERDGPRFEAPGEVLFPSGCAGAWRRELLARSGLFDEWFGAYGEDADLGIRCRLLGAGCRYVPGARVRHRFSATAGPHSARKAYLVERNRIAVLAKNLPWPMVLLAPAATAWRLALHGLALLLGRGSAGEGAAATPAWRLAMAMAGAWGAAALALPRLVAARRRLKAAGALGGWAALRLLRRFPVSAFQLALAPQAPARLAPPPPAGEDPARPPAVPAGPATRP